MTHSYPFPDDVRDPDRQQPNPFAEDHVDGADVASPLGASDVATEYRPQYAATHSARGRTVLFLGGLGLVLSLLGWWTYAGYQELTIMPILAFAFALPAIVMGGGALRAMNAGAMKNDQRRHVYWGALMGIVGLGNSVIYIIVGIVVLDLLS